MVGEQRIFIKGMVCDRCIRAVRQALHDLDIPVTGVKLGEVTTVSALSAPDIKVLSEKLGQLGFSLLEDQKTALVRDIKLLVEEVYSGEFDFPDDFRFSDLLTRRLHREYGAASAIFSAAEGMTLEKYIMAFRMEKVKELLVYTARTLADIAWILGFSSAAHLSRQFKSYTGLNTSHFSALRKSKLYTSSGE
ncbi:helix-turn-helix domain-containing protein [Chitinophaga lutea]